MQENSPRGTCPRDTIGALNAVGMRQEGEHVVSVIVPAHNEARTINRLLAGLADGEDASLGLEIIVVCNGCTDDTAEVARRVGGPVQVIEVGQAGKSAALSAGDDAATQFPRLYVDADVEIGASDVNRLAAAVAGSGYLAAGPRRVIPMTGVVWPVRWYYEVWQRLPQVSEGLFGRGVIAVSAEGHSRLTSLPHVTADDLVFSEAFGPHERVIVEDAVVVVHPPRTLVDLLRRRVRITRGNREADANGLRTDSARTTPHVLWHLATVSPRWTARVTVFALVSAAGRLWSRWLDRSGSTVLWPRDESSRA